MGWLPVEDRSEFLDHCRYEEETGRFSFGERQEGPIFGKAGLEQTTKTPHFCEAFVRVLQS